ncbi:MAG: hypothetical protein KDK45_24400, partial [Leptospiraceae bacterium]|nr:hypothetical protein [Leptospiraceae bacterium]
MNRLKKIVKDFKLEIQFETEVEKFIETVFDELHQDRYYTIKIKDSPSFESIKKKEETFKKEVVYTLLDNLFSITRVSSNLSEKSKNNDWDKLYRVAYIFRIIYEAIVRSKIDFTEDELIKFLENSFSDFLTSSSMPNTYIIKQIKYYTDKNGSSERVVSFLQKFIEKDSKLFPSLYNK